MTEIPSPSNAELHRAVTFLRVALSRLESRVNSLEQVLEHELIRKAIEESAVRLPQ